MASEVGDEDLCWIDLVEVLDGYGAEWIEAIGVAWLNSEMVGEAHVISGPVAALIHFATGLVCSSGADLIALSWPHLPIAVLPA